MTTSVLAAMVFIYSRNNSMKACLWDINTYLEEEWWDNVDQDLVKLFAETNKAQTEAGLSHGVERVPECL